MQKAVEAVANKLGDTGRILVRESGTEPLLRVMVEAPEDDTCRACVDEVVAVIRAKRPRGISITTLYQPTPNGCNNNISSKKVVAGGIGPVYNGDDIRDGEVKKDAGRGTAKTAKRTACFRAGSRSS